ncbi:MAG TPA: hypothetical protein PKW82_08535, partial [Spirochaetales bacterium]|nr:hypothetical protein [Spirochaetales bacterium]
VDRIQYGRLASSCGVMPADYKMTAQTSVGRGVYSFCMCPGGEVIACRATRDAVRSLPFKGPFRTRLKGKEDWQIVYYLDYGTEAPR